MEAALKEIGDDFCIQFRGGICPHTKAHTPRSFCFDVCKRGKRLFREGKIAPHEPPSMAQMASHFGNAMAKWIKMGLPYVSWDEYQRRRKICIACSGGWKCPKCGCMIWAKAALATEDCAKWSDDDGRPNDIPESVGQFKPVQAGGSAAEPVGDGQ